MRFLNHKGANAFFIWRFECWRREVTCVSIEKHQEVMSTACRCSVFSRHHRSTHLFHAVVFCLLLQTEWSGLSVCLSVGHDREFCKNGRTDRDAVWGYRAKVAFTLGLGSRQRKENFRGHVPDTPMFALAGYNK